MLIIPMGPQAPALNGADSFLGSYYAAPRVFGWRDLSTVLGTVCRMVIKRCIYQVL